MKVPHTFRPDKDLEDKTEQLIKNAKILEEPEDINPDDIYDEIADLYDGTQLSKKKSNLAKDSYRKFCWGGNNAD